MRKEISVKNIFSHCDLCQCVACHKLLIHNNANAFHACAEMEILMKQTKRFLATLLLLLCISTCIHSKESTNTTNNPDSSLNTRSLPITKPNYY